MAKVGQEIDARNAGWTFEGIAGQFDEHVRLSVPLYDEGHELACRLGDFFLPPGATVVELGTSTGVLAKKFLDHHKDRADIRYIGIDRVDGMIEAARQRCAGDVRAEFIADDISAAAFDDVSLVLSYCTMQFVHPRIRQEMFDKVYRSLQWGGAFYLFEKVRAPDARFQDLTTQLYHEFKLRNGFDEKEILSKQRSLKGVLEPFSTQGNLDLLARAGFRDVMTLIKYVCFEGFLGIK
jgi:tRNA (cmo5U34)-methyltransferase